MDTKQRPIRRRLKGEDRNLFGNDVTKYADATRRRKRYDVLRLRFYARTEK
jgi:hypothetical protein